MAEERVFEINVGAEIDRYFDDSSLSNGSTPNLVLIMGGPAGGKTTMRKDRFSSGFVLVDAAEIFLSLSRGEWFPFPGPFEEIMQIIGPLIAKRAISERRHIVTELIGADFEPTKALIDAMLAIGYHLNLQAITCDIEEAQRRNLNRGDDCISAFYAEHFQRAWLHDAAVDFLAKGSKSDSRPLL
jgi:hypothetical protein